MNTQTWNWAVGEQATSHHGTPSVIIRYCQQKERLTRWNNDKAPVLRSPVSALCWQTVCRLTEHNILLAGLCILFSHCQERSLPWHSHWPVPSPLLGGTQSPAIPKAAPGYLQVVCSKLLDLRKSRTFQPGAVSSVVPVLPFLLLLQHPAVPLETQTAECGSKG